LELTQAFVAVLLSGWAGPLTDRQTDVLDTIRIRVAHALDARDTGPADLAELS
jgi:hypothetical protein